jgi:hypothetical protein
MDINNLTAKFAAARTKQAEGPIGSTQQLLGRDYFSDYRVDENGQAYLDTSMIPAAAVGGIYGAYGLPATGRAINRLGEAARYVQSPVYRPSTLLASPSPIRRQSIFPTYAELLTQSTDPTRPLLRPQGGVAYRTNPTLATRALALQLPSAVPGIDTKKQQFQEFGPDAANSRDLVPVGPLMDRPAMMAALTSRVAPFADPNSATQRYIEGRISQMGGEEPPSKKNPAGKPPDTELQSVTRQQLFNRPFLDVLLGRVANPEILNTYQNPARPGSLPPLTNTSYMPGFAGGPPQRVEVPTRDVSQGVVGRLANLSQKAPTGKGRAITGLLGGALAAELAGRVQGDVNLNPFMASIPEAPAR